MDGWHEPIVLLAHHDKYLLEEARRHVKPNSSLFENYARQYSDLRSEPIHFFVMV